MKDELRGESLGQAGHGGQAFVQECSEIWMGLEELGLVLGCLCQAQPVHDLLLAPTPHHHEAFLEAICEVLGHLQDSVFGSLVHEIRLGEDPYEGHVKVRSPLHLSPGRPHCPPTASTTSSLSS